VYSIDVPTSADLPHIDVSRITDSLVHRLYNFFNLTDDDVPYANTAHDAIDFTRILELHP
jgi:hypothetical protein